MFLASGPQNVSQVFFFIRVNKIKRVSSQPSTQIKWF